MEGKMAEVKSLDRIVAEELAKLVDILVTDALIAQFEKNANTFTAHSKLLLSEEEFTESEMAKKALIDTMKEKLAEKHISASTNVMIAVAAYKNAVGNK